MSHHVDQCKHGKVVSQCRCPSPNKTVNIVPCPSSCNTETEMPTPSDLTPEQLTEFFENFGESVKLMPKIVRAKNAGEGLTLSAEEVKSLHWTLDLMSGATKDLLG